MFKQYPTAYRWLRTIGSCDPKRNTVRQKHQRQGDRLSCNPPFHIFTLQMERLGDTKEQYERQSKGQAEQFLGVIKKAAEKAGVSCDTDYVTSSHPYEMIIKAAEKKGCDLIMMASHGRRGVQGLLIGSETQKVLTHTRVPVLVLR
jgi:nucleotide-binding universal stress UspA family protein